MTRRQMPASAMPASTIAVPVIGRDVVGRIGEVDAQPHLRGLVANDIHSDERAADDRGIRHITPVKINAGVSRRVGPVHIGAEGVEHADIPAAVKGRGDDRAADEPGTAGDEELHSATSSARIAATASGEMSWRGV